MGVDVETDECVHPFLIEDWLLLIGYLIFVKIIEKKRVEIQ